MLEHLESPLQTLTHTIDSRSMQISQVATFPKMTASMFTSFLSPSNNALETNPPNSLAVNDLSDPPNAPNGVRLLN
ncbi:hypothetical protein HMI54_011384 [Coelomomyces lativittatus]|nr:hypothetical protein HMI54_011384 [Coelomomyces lativittatus]